MLWHTLVKCAHTLPSTAIEPRHQLMKSGLNAVKAAPDGGIMVLQHLQAQQPIMFQK
jgi:hypothetical protein